MLRSPVRRRWQGLVTLLGSIVLNTSSVRLNPTVLFPSLFRMVNSRLVVVACSLSLIRLVLVFNSPCLNLIVRCRVVFSGNRNTWDVWVNDDAGGFLFRRLGLLAFVTCFTALIVISFSGGGLVAGEIVVGWACVHGL